MLTALFRSALAACLLACVASAQDAESSLQIPTTFSAGAMYTERLQMADPGATPAAAGFRAMLYPTLKLGSHWFGYAAIQVRSAPYFYYDASSPERRIDTNVIQAYVGYSFRRRNFSMVVKAGRLSSAFGSFPLRYDDTENPLLDQPLSYVTQTPIRGNEVPWSVNALRGWNYGAAMGSYSASAPGGGLEPVTLYGLPGIETDISSGPIDARIQLTSGSPANPQSLAAGGQYIQWTAGGGYTIHHGLRVGVSAFRGPYLNTSVDSDLPAGSKVRDFPATGLGVDAQWNRGHWAMTGEWQTFRFDSPYFVVSPSIASGYGEIKRILTPRFYVAGRVGYLTTGRVVDWRGGVAGSFAPELHSYELGFGSWLNRFELLKVSYAWLEMQGSSGTRDNVLGLQFVTSLRPPGWSFR